MARKRNRKKINKVTRGGTSGGQSTDLSRSPTVVNQNNGAAMQEYNPGWKLPTATNQLPPQQSQSFLGPQDPVNPLAPRDVAGRGWDFPLGVNRQVEPRAIEPISFQDLKRLADNCEIVRLCIETRKDQMSRLEWNIVPRDDDANSEDPKFLTRIQSIEKFLRLPDGDNDWNSWLRMLLEQLMVIDAPTLFPKMSLGGDLLALEVVDGSTIKLIIDEWGRTPDAPYPAYQQVLKGIPAINFTKDELIYKPRNKRVDRIYGYSQVEQILTMINIAIRRELFQLGYFTDGTDPQGFLETPADWTMEQIKAFQTYWDELMTDNLATRRKIKMVPPGAKYTPVKEAILTDSFDEWIARIVCFCFSIPPTAFTKQTNRATAESSAEIAEEEGLHPLMLWMKSTIDYIIEHFFHADDLVFQWNTDQPLDALSRAQVDKIYIENGVLSINEIRDGLGKDSIPGMDAPMIIQPGGPPILLKDIASGAYGPDAEAQRQNDQADQASERKINEAKAGVQTPVNGAHNQNVAPTDKGKNNDQETK
jgi:hypothetical protein